MQNSPKELTEIEKEVIEEIKATLKTELDGLKQQLDELKEHELLNAKKIDNIQISISSVNKQMEELDRKIEDIDLKAITVDDIKKDDKKLEKSVELQERISDDIADLQFEKGKLEYERDNKKSSIIKKFYQKKIDKYEQKIAKLKTSLSTIEKDQKVMIMSKEQIKNKKSRKIAKQEATKEHYENLQKENEEARADLVTSTGIIGKIENKIFDIRGKKYQKNIEKAEKKLMKLQGGNNNLKSGNALKMPKKILDKIRRKFQYGNGPIPKVA